MYEHVEETFKYLPFLTPGLDLYEFGVYSGNTLCRLIEGFKQADVPLRHAYGFDSFEGLPKEAEGVYFHPDWQPGVFNAQEWYGVDTPKKVMRIIRAKAAPLGVPLTLVKGWFRNTLTPELVYQTDMSRASYVHIDTDLYVSAYEALDFIFSNGLAGPKSLFRYDDWCSVPEWEAGQSLAHKQITEKYGLHWTRLSTNVFVLAL